MSPNETLLADIEALLAAAKLYDVEKGDRITRLNLLGQVEALHYQLDDPAEAMFRQFVYSSQTAAMMTILEIGALEKIPRNGSISASNLAKSLKFDEEVLIRLMRQLTATGIVKLVSEDEYAHTRFSLAYIQGTEVEFYKLYMSEIVPVGLRLPEYMATHESSSIFNPKISPFAWANNAEGKNFFEVLFDHPARLIQFNNAMTTQEAALPVLGIFPFSSLINSVDRSDPERTFFVDVAGGRGQSLLQIQREIEECGGGFVKAVLEDMKVVLDAIPDNQLPGVERIVIDFFEPQPVKNANIYYIRRVIHNWQDKDAQLILKNIAEAMAPDSRLLIADMVVPNQPEGPDMTVYWMDLAMLCIGGKERSEKEFAILLNSAGLKLVKIWRSKIASQAVIECQLKGSFNSGLGNMAK